MPLAELANLLLTTIVTPVWQVTLQVQKPELVFRTLVLTLGNGTTLQLNNARVVALVVIAVQTSTHVTLAHPLPKQWTQPTLLENVRLVE
jgi:hypothetical protein